MDAPRLSPGSVLGDEGRRLGPRALVARVRAPPPPRAADKRGVRRPLHPPAAAAPPVGVGAIGAARASSRVPVPCGRPRRKTRCTSSARCGVKPLSRSPRPRRARSCAPRRRRPRAAGRRGAARREVKGARLDDIGGRRRARRRDTRSSAETPMCAAALSPTTGWARPRRRTCRARRTRASISAGSRNTPEPRGPSACTTWRQCAHRRRETLDHLVLVVINAVQALKTANGIPARPRRDSAPPTEGDGARGIARRRRGRGRRGQRRRIERASARRTRAIRSCAPLMMGRGRQRGQRAEPSPIPFDEGGDGKILNLRTTNSNRPSLLLLSSLALTKRSRCRCDKKRACVLVLATPIPIYRNIRLTSLPVMFVGVKGPQDRAKVLRHKQSDHGSLDGAHRRARWSARERRRCARE